MCIRDRAYRNGAPVKLSKVADVVDDVENVRQAAWMNETPAVIMNIRRQPGANIIPVSYTHLPAVAHPELLGIIRYSA